MNQSTGAQHKQKLQPNVVGVVRERLANHRRRLDPSTRLAAPMNVTANASVARSLSTLTAEKAQQRAQYADVTDDDEVFVGVMPGDADTHEMHEPNDDVGIIVE